jgi:beta-lactamase regulating signal transducer with metallopeptidase domain
MFSHNLTQAIGWTVVHNIWQATAITLVSALLLALLRQKSSNLRYVVANVGLLMVLVSAVATFCNYYHFSQQASFTFEPISVQESTFQKDTPLTVTKIFEQKTAEATLNWAQIKAFCNRNLYAVAMAWCLGAAFFLLRLLANIGYVIYLRNRLNIYVDEYWENVLEGLRKRMKNVPKIELRESALVQSPLVVGYLKPMILFPIGIINQLNTNEVEAILAHELAHVMRHDYLLNILQNIVEALFYFHPAVWWLSSQIRAERENSCDDIALQLCESSITYAKALVTVQEMAHAAPQLALAFAGNNRKTQLMLRVQRVLNQPKSKNNMIEKIVASAVVMLMMGYFTFAENTPNTTGVGHKNGADVAQKQAEIPAPIIKDYLTFVKNGVKDSIPTIQTLTDGKYSFNDNTQSVDITVKDKNVALLSINGVEIASKDFPKFEKMIDKVINAKNAPAYENDMGEQMGEQMADLNGNLMYLADMDQHNADMSRYDAEMSQFDANEVRRVVEMNADQIEKAQKLQKEIEKLTKKGVFRNNGLKVQQKIQELNQLGFQLNNGQLLQMEDWGDASDMEAPMSPIPSMPPMVITHFDSFDYQDQDNTPWKDAIEEALRDCGALEDEPVHFSLSSRKMVVNGKSYPEDCVKKYIKIYERYSGRKFTQNTVLELDFNTEDVEADAEQATADAEKEANEDRSSEIIKALVHDGYIKNAKQFSMSINDKSLMADGKKLPNEVFERYKKRFNITKGTNITMSGSWSEN